MSKSVPRRSRPQPRVASCLLVALMLVSLTPVGIARTGVAQAEPPPVDCGRLEVGAPVERTIEAGEKQVYRVEAAAGDYLSITIDQRGINVVVSFYAPDRSLLLKISRTSGGRDVERVDVVVPASGTCTLELETVLPKPVRGRYVASVDARRPATSEDRRRAETRALLAEVYRKFGGNEDKDVQRELLTHLERARVVFHDLGDLADEAEILNESADIRFYSLGELQLGVNDWDRMIALARQVGNLRLLVLAILERAWAAYNMSDGETMIACYKEAHRLCKGLDDPYLASTAIEGLGHIAPTDEAIERYTEALSIRSSLLGDWACTHILHNLSGSWIRKQDYVRAREYAERALVAARDWGSLTDEVYGLIIVAQTYCIVGSHEKAIPFYEQALAIGSRALNNGRRDTLIWLAECENAVGRFDRAREHAEEALQLLERNFDSISTENLRFAMNIFKSRFFSVYVGSLLGLHHGSPAAGYDAEAFRASEQAHARELLSTLVLSGVDTRGAVEPELVEREKELRSRLDSALEAQIRLLSSKERDPERAAIAVRSVTERKVEYEEVQSKIRDQSLFYASSRTRSLDFAEIQSRLLDDDTLLLEYLVGPKQSFLFAVSKTSLKTYELASTDEIYKATMAVRRGLSGEGTAESYEHAAATLSRLILEPVAAELGTKRLAIVADHALHQIPFAALPDPSSAEGEPIIVRHEVTMLPSATAAVFQRERFESRAPAPKSVAVLADPIFARNDARVRPHARVDRTKRSTTTDRGRAMKPTKPAQAGGDLTRARTSWEAAGLLRKGEEFARLPWTRLEARRIVGAAPRGSTHSALDFAASESTVKSRGIAQYRVLHFATHGFLDAAQPELSGLVLSLVNERGEPEDGFLSVPEVFNLKFPAELVVLSGCETALGKSVAGEGMVGLTRAFMYAGAPRVIASLWAVQDEATAELMGRMYEGIYRRGLSPAAALREAQVSMLREARWRSPRQWAAFVHQGDWRCPKL